MPHVQRLALPITYIHGVKNQTWLPSSTERTVDWLTVHNGGQWYRRHLIPHYGHLDCMFGKDAASDVYPFILEHLEANASPPV
jgi:cholesterol oxidase